MTSTTLSKWMTELGQTPERATPRVLRGLVALTPGTLEPSGAKGAGQALDAMEHAAAAAIEGGLRAIVVREPSLPDGAVLELARRLRARLDVVGATGGWLGLHDRLHLAEAACADAVHLGRTSLPLPAARTVVGDSIAIGVSSHDEDGADYAGADFHFHAPVFPPTSKPLYGRGVLGWDRVEEYARHCVRPVFALGGLTAARLRARQVELDGARSDLAGAALIGGLWGTDDAPLTGAYGPLRDLGRISNAASELAGISAELFDSEREVTP